MRPLKVCYIIDDLHLGGAQTQLLELIRALPRDAFLPEVISLSTEKLSLESAFRESGVSLTLIPQSGKWSWSTFLALRRALGASRPDIVHTWLFTADLYGRPAAWLARVPVILSGVRGPDDDKPWHYVAVDRILRHVTDGFTVNAAVIGDVIKRREGIPPARIHTIYNGIDPAAFQPTDGGVVRARVGAASGEPLVGIIGRLAPEKGHVMFLEAAAQVARRLPAVKFAIAGQGPLREELEGRAQALGVADRVTFLGPQRPITPVHAALDILVVTSHFEGCSNVILEAMAMARPVIATAVGGNPELVADGRTGLLVPDGDAALLADAIVSLATDPARARAMGAEGRREFEARFTLDRMIRETAALYGSLARPATPVAS